ncbi:MAG: sigma-70 family RNA polymerase sigma factor [Chloroflexi bacterium]|nr:sigma-70 family RNA polymerase sigma factor [Chloroflexota bacterium]
MHYAEYALENQEAEWIVKAQQGDKEAFSRLVSIYQVPIYNLCFRMLGEAKDAEDAAQETFIRAYKAVKKFDIERKFSSWLFSIASNYCIDQHRRKRLTTFSYDSLPVPDIQDSSLNIESAVTRNEGQEQVQELLESLNPKDRAAVILRYWHENSYEEIAATLSLTTSAVKSRLHRARRELATSWISNQQSAIAIERTHHGSQAI